jgi:predicted nucleotide-binding protein (sugar kinase/HSP70/actin superfamily)
MANVTPRVEFTKEMKRDYKVLIPNMAPIHFELLKNLFCYYGYDMELLYNDGREVVDTGLKYVHNDTCYPALLVIGQMINALESGKYDVKKTALMITQTGGGCRASNYIHLLRKALIKAGMSYVPVISLNLSGLEKNSGFVFTIPMMVKSLYALAYADMVMLLDNQVKPYEINTGDSAERVKYWVENLSKELETASITSFSAKNVGKTMDRIAKDFAAIPVEKRRKLKVGIVGEIYVKYSSLANNGLEEFLASQNCEVMVPGILAFIIFKLDNRIEDIKLYGGSKAKMALMNLFMEFFLKIEKIMITAVQQTNRFNAPSPYSHLKQLASRVIGAGCKMGEGWLLTAEMMELIENGYPNVVCAQPFGCLPNHIVGKGMIRKLKELYQKSNIVPIDYDPGATKVNQENRIKLMLAVANENHN